jgi:hypothetical protein
MFGRLWKVALADCAARLLCARGEAKQPGENRCRSTAQKRPFTSSETSQNCLIRRDLRRDGIFTRSPTTPAGEK